MSPETPSMQASIKRSATGTGINPPPIADDQDSGRLTLHSVNNSVKHMETSEDLKEMA